MKTTVADNGNTVWHFSRAELTALLAHMTTDESRMSHCGLVLDVERGAAYTTDGHRAAKVWGEKVDHDLAIKPAKPFFVPRQLIEQVVSAAKRNDVIEITIAEPSVVASVAGQLISGGVLDVTPMPIEQVMPNYEVAKHKGVPAGVNPRYLADLNLVSKACPPWIEKQARGKTVKHYDALTLFPPTSPPDPFLARISCKANATEWAVCIMPMRI